MFIENIMKRIGSLVVSGLMLTMLIQPTAVQAETGEKEIKIFHTNDTHSRVDNFSVIKGYIDSVEADGKILVDAGDTYHGQSFATLERGSSIAKILKAMGYDAMVPGNHDFNYGQDRLHELEVESGVPVLAANVTKNENPDFGTSIIKEVDGIKFGIFGLATPETAYKTNPNNVTGLDFGTKQSVIDTAQSIVDELEDKGVDVVVAISHLGIDAESDLKATDIGANVTGLDLIIDGHSHSKLSDYESFNNSHDTKITSTGQYSENGVGEVTLVMNPDNTIKELKMNITVVRDADKNPIYSENGEIKTLIEDIKAAQEPILNTVVGHTPIDLDGARSSVRFGHTNLGRVLTSAILAETGADIAITNGGGIRDSIKAGDITKGDIIKVMPFGNYIVTKSLTGAEIIQALEHGMVIGSGSFTHFAGIEVQTIIYTETIAGVSKERHKVVSATINSTELQLDKQYVVATNDFMGVGGDGYTMFKEKPVINEFSALDEALINYISAPNSSELIIADDKDIRLETKKTFAVNEAKGILADLIEANADFTVEAIEDSANVYLVINVGENESVKIVIENTSVEEINSIIEEIKNPTEPEVPTEPEEPLNPEVPTTPETDGDKNNVGATLPNTGGVDSKNVIILGTMLLLVGTVLFKKKRVA